MQPSLIKLKLFLCILLAWITIHPASAFAQNQNEKIDASTMHGKVLAGYQGWFSHLGDGSDVSENWGTWGHWFNWYTWPTAKNLRIDMWPDTTEYTKDELYPTNMRMADGKQAMVFSSYNRKTVLRHFSWMKDYGLDGIFAQRFVLNVRNRDFALFNFSNKVLRNIKEGADTYGRVFAVEYDTTNTPADSVVEDIINDWKYLVDRLRITKSKRYLHHNGKPVLVVWGFGFDDGRHDFSASQAMELIQWFKEAKSKYQVTLLGGVPEGWRTCKGLSFPATDEENWPEVYRSFDVIVPWTIGRYHDIDSANRWRKRVLIRDIQEAAELGIEYMPVVFPGFSYHNMHRDLLRKGKKRIPKLNQIPRNGGTFYWRQFYNAIWAFNKAQTGYAMIKVAMFDEMDEGTAIFKLATTKSHVPKGVDLVTLDIDRGYSPPSDWYLYLTGEASRMLRGEIPFTSVMPAENGNTN